MKRMCPRRLFIRKLNRVVFTDVLGACLLSVSVWILLPGGQRTVPVSVQVWRMKGAAPGRCR